MSQTKAQLIDNLVSPITGALGSASAPTFSFTADPNTGIYSPGADQLAISTNGTGRLFIDSSGRVLVGTSTSRTVGDIAHNIQLEGASGNTGISIVNNYSTLADPSAYITLARSRSSTVGGSGLVSSGDYLGLLDFTGNDGSSFKVAARIGAFVDGTPGASDMPGRLVFSTTADGASNPTERLRITSAGLVGVGTASPRSLLSFGTADTSGTNGINLYDNGGNYRTGIGATSSYLRLYTPSDGSLQLGRLSTSDGSTFLEAARIDSSGRLLVGTSSARTIGTGNFHIQSEGSGSIVGISTTRNDNNTAGSNFRFVKTRGTAAGSTTIVQSGDDLGNVSWWGTDGTNAVEAATITAKVDGTPGANDMPGRLVFSTTADGASSPTERMRITSAGRLGIGNSNPRGIIHVGADINGGATDAAAINIKQTSTTKNTGIYLERSADRRGHYIYISSTYDALTFERNNLGTSAVTMVLDRDGNVGIGTTSPSQLLHCERTTAGVTALFGVNDGTFNPRLAVYGGSTGTTIQNTWSSSASNLIFANGGAVGSGTEAMRIDSSGRLLVGTSTSVSTSDTFTPSVQVAGTGTLAAMSVQRYAANTSCPYIILQKSRSGTIGSQAIVNSGDILGAVAFEGSDGSAFQKGAEISAQVDGTPGAGDMPGRLVFSTTADGASSPTERMRINSGGRTSITSAENTWRALTVTNSANVSGNGGIHSYLGSNTNDTSSYHFIGSTGGPDRVLIYGNGNIVNQNNSYGSLSDSKLKENIVDANSQWDDLKALQVRKYNFKEGQTHTQIGLIAQEVELVSPGLVSESPDRDDEGNDLGTVTKSVNYSVLYMKAVKALQEAMERIEQLETSNADLLARVTALESA
jgi:hypothetical protein